MYWFYLQAPPIIILHFRRLKILHNLKIYLTDQHSFIEVTLVKYVSFN